MFTLTITKFDNVYHGTPNLHSFHASNGAKLCQDKNARKKEIGPQFSPPLSSFISRLAAYRCQRGWH